LLKSPGRIGPEVKRLANLYGVSERTLRRWMVAVAYRKNPDVIGLLPRRRGPALGHRGIPPEERMLGEVIDVWATRKPWPSERGK
jgi:hypothetical protein